MQDFAFGETRLVGTVGKKTGQRLIKMRSLLFPQTSLGLPFPIYAGSALWLTQVRGLVQFSELTS
jgi:hypothetical protein